MEQAKYMTDCTIRPSRRLKNRELEDSQGSEG